MVEQDIISPVTTPTPWVSSPPQKERETQAVFGSQVPKPGDSERTLPPSNDRGGGDAFTRGQGIYES